jgi:hypothetical protein
MNGYFRNFITLANPLNEDSIIPINEKEKVILEEF